MTSLMLPSLPDHPFPERPGRSTPALLRILAALVLLIAVVLAAGVTRSVSDLRAGMRRMGGSHAAQALAAVDLQADLTALDSYLTSARDALHQRDALGHRFAVSGFHDALAQANADLGRLAAVTAGDRAARRDLDAVADALTRYQMAARPAMIFGGPGHGAAEAAHAVMDMTLLPSARRLAEDGMRDLARTSRAERDDLTVALRAGTLLGLALLGALAGLQVALVLRHRRLINPPLALATVLACAFVLASGQLLHDHRQWLGPVGSVPGPAAVARVNSWDSREEIRALERWELLPTAGAAVLAGLVIAGIRPRLAEFR